MNFELESVTPCSDRLSPRQEAKARVKKYKDNLEAQKEVVAGPLANQHQEIVQPRLDADQVLQKSLRLTDEELKKI